ncbi:hypothetical protein BDY17DRAFT_300707 [Neohortaea acidophila]|uniref:Uncharacterized protein n=1 Tax=Neohortaea acidophila TaxID=245834 RepID=A0A6A6PMG5_9PEZI|nr:uncharacterized protein BDY17DRAFT_300707 [Neohortaea acidophila]KAF2481105.1 hypothetical protein BDY17DRAFT_300707 [Neohortaea acidophila]
MWQRLCRDIGVPEQPSIAKSKKVPFCLSLRPAMQPTDTYVNVAQALKGIYINITDFVEACEAGEPVRVFHSYRALLNDLLRDRERIFPKDKAKGNPILTWMLVKVF